MEHRRQPLSWMDVDVGTNIESRMDSLCCLLSKITRKLSGILIVYSIIYLKLLNVAHFLCFAFGCGRKEPVIENIRVVGII